jgi:hypothetical protein
METLGTWGQACGLKTATVTTCVQPNEADELVEHERVRVVTSTFETVVMWGFVM